MALPVRVQRGHVVDPFEIARNEFQLLGRLMSRGLFDESDGGGAMASLSNFGVDIREDANHIYVEADLPGFRKEDVDIAIDEGTLTITAEHDEEINAPGRAGQAARAGASGQQGQAGQQVQPGQQGQAAQQSQSGQQDQSGQQGQQNQQQKGPRAQRENYLLRERTVRRFVRSFALPPNIDDQHVDAKLEDGVLSITLKKREDAKPKHVKVG